MSTPSKINVSEKRAFPLPPEIVGDTSFEQPGMTLRDYFAAKAADAIFGKYGFDTPFCKDASPMPSIARYAYELADAMLAEREKSK